MDEDDDDTNFGQSEIRPRLVKNQVTKKVKVQKPVKVKKPKVKSKQLKCKKQKGTSKLVKSLREEELEGNKIFHLNIEVKNNFFYCKLCAKFSTTTKMIARAHVVSCGQTKKKGRPQKSSECLECNEKFSSVKELHRHHSMEHSSRTYCCSTCLKSFKRRQAYARHLASHREVPRLRCQQCSKVFRYKCNLKRHMESHRGPYKTVETLRQEEEETPSEFVDFEIDLNERRIGENYSGVFSVKELPPPNSKYLRNHTSFQSTLGLSIIDDWQIYLGISKAFSLPLSNDDPEAVETCIYTDEYGKETVQFAWNSVAVSSDSLVSEAVQSASLDDHVGASNEEVLKIVDSILSDNGVKNDSTDVAERDPVVMMSKKILGSTEGKVYFFSIKYVDLYSSSYIYYSFGSNVIYSFVCILS